MSRSQIGMTSVEHVLRSNAFLVYQNMNYVNASQCSKELDTDPPNYVARRPYTPNQDNILWFASYAINIHDSSQHVDYFHFL